MIIVIKIFLINYQIVSLKQYLYIILEKRIRLKKKKRKACGTYTRLKCNFLSFPCCLEQVLLIFSHFFLQFKERTPFRSFHFSCSLKIFGIFPKKSFISKTISIYSYICDFKVVRDYRGLIYIQSRKIHA